ncbi:MAG: hypothetical protein ACFFCP_17350 [Promethearchaeota archaeon]
MTEASVDGINVVDSELKSDSRLIILLGLPEGIKNVSRKLSSVQDTVRIRRGLYVIHGFSEIHEAILESNPFTSFVKTREIPVVRVKSEDVYSTRAYTVVSFSFVNPTAQQKKYVERLIKKTTGIRLRPGVILFPLLRSKERRRIIGDEENRLLIDSKEFSRLIREKGGDTIRWSRLRIINLNGDAYIKLAVEKTLHSDLSALETRIRTLREKSRDSSIALSQLKRRYTILSRSFRRLKTKWMLAKRLWFYDAEKALKRTYNMLLTARRTIESAET